VECFALDLEHGFLMRWIEHELVALVGACMTCDLEGAIENPYGDIGGHQG